MLYKSKVTSEKTQIIFDCEGLIDVQERPTFPIKSSGYYLIIRNTNIASSLCVQVEKVGRMYLRFSLLLSPSNQHVDFTTCDNGVYYKCYDHPMYLEILTMLVCNSVNFHVPDISGSTVTVDTLDVIIDKLSIKLNGILCVIDRFEITNYSNIRHVIDLFKNANKLRFNDDVDQWKVL